MVAIAPGLVFIFRRPHIKNLPRVFTMTALGFFLFSFQVHEKSILLPLIPASLALFGGDIEERKWTVWVNVIGTMRYPLSPLLIQFMAASQKRWIGLTVFSCVGVVDVFKL
jgi:alpha-1,3-glucosyltransferase